MKRILSLLALIVSAVLFPNAGGSAQHNDIRVGTYALRGPVQTMRVEEATVIAKDGKFVEGPRVLRMTAVFSEDGGRPEFGIYDEKGALTRRIEIKYEGGREIEFLNYDGAGRMWLRGVNLYDENGFVKEKATYNSDGSLRSKTTYKRNAKGAAEEWVETDAKGNNLDRWVNTFDDAGELRSSERTIYRPDGSVSAKEFRDVPAKRSESVSYNRDGSIAQTRVREDRRINEFGPDGSLQRTIEISNPDRLSSETVHNSDGTANNYSPIPDEIDSHGNWTKQTKWVSDANGRRPIKVAYRTLTYFSDSKAAPDK